MHLHKGAVRNTLFAIALVTFALPLATPLATPTQAQTAGVATIGAAGCTPTPIGSTPGSGGTTPCKVGVTPNAPPGTSNPLMFNALGVPHFVTFTCDADILAEGLVGLGGTTGSATVAPGCYNVTASVQDITSGSAAAIESATCGGVAATPTGGTVSCAPVSNPICPVTTSPTGTGATAPCTAPGTSTTAPATLANTVQIKINPGAPHAYTISFTGYIPPNSLGVCPAGTTSTTGLTIIPTRPPGAAPIGPTTMCRFELTTQKKYVEITNITLATVPPNTPCGGTLIYSEGFKAFFGPRCAVIATATGTVTLKTGVNCANEPANGTSAAATPTSGTDFPPGAVYQCVNGSLLVTNIPISTNLLFTVTGPGSFNTLNTLGTSCAGVTGSTTRTAPSGTVVFFCPTGPGSGTIQACLAGPLPNNQPPVCSNKLTFAFTVTQARAVPYVRWAGEKVALTKCFGPGLAGSPVEFTLKGNNPGLNATLLPTDLASVSGGEPNGNSFPTADTIWTVTDVNGCASVLGLADGEGQMTVDAAIFNVTGPGVTAGGPIVNEHAFEVFYLKFDHLDLENIQFQTYQTATALAPYFSYLGGTPAFNGAAKPPPPATFTLPGPPLSGQVASAGTGFAVPLCQTQYVRALVHGYLEIPGDPSGRPASNVPIPGAPANSAGSYVLPAGRWVLPEDWPLLATFAGIGLPGQPSDFSSSPVAAWDINSGYAFNPTGENAVICSGTGTLPPPTFATNASNLAVDNISMGNVDLGPCFGPNPPASPGTTPYSTAGPGYPNLCNALGGGETVGIGPFDALQSCTDPFPLPQTPAGAAIIGGLPGLFACPPGAPAGPCTIPAGLNSTYLPNGTLNQWDAPMPPAQISFGITSSTPNGTGPGFLTTIDKTGLYALTLVNGKPVTPTSSTTAAGCPTGYVLAPSGTVLASGQDVSGYCVLSMNPDPFYAEAIPASPFIPPVTNNGGYLWNSWNFSAGNVTAVSSSAPFSGVTAGGFVPGESTSAVAPAASLPGGVCTPPYSTAITGTTTCTIRGGTNITSLGAGCTPAGGAAANSVIVANGLGFMPGMTVEIYSNTTGASIVGRGTPALLTITGVASAPQPGFPNAYALTFSTASVTAALGAATCLTPFTYVVIAEQFGLPVPSAAAFTPGMNITIGSLAARNLTAPVALIDPTNNIVYVSNTTAVAFAFGPCTGAGGASSGISRPSTTGPSPTCEPAGLVGPGTLIEAGPKAAGGLGAALSGPPPNPYPFWQFVGTTLNSKNPTAATVYSDNHGEAVVGLVQGITTTTTPSSTGTCPSGYTALSLNNVVVSCELPISALSPTYANVATALAKFSASTPGCIQTSASGTAYVVPNATIGATGPAAGQICVNALGGIELGASAYLGQTTVQAVADYPYTRGEHPPISSAPLTKVFQSAFQKSLTVSAGSAGPANTTSYTVTVTALDVCGNPLFAEPVILYALGNAGAGVLTPVNVGSVIATSGNSTTVTVRSDTGTATLTLEVLNTAVGTSGLVVKAVWPIEHIERFATVIPGSTPGATTSVVYAPGYQMVGGPAGSNFSVSEALFAYDPHANAYTNNTASSGSVSSAAPSCAGYYAYFAAAMSLSLPSSGKTGDTAGCTLAAGWNLIGNPFATPAKLPSGVTAFHWNGSSYDSVTAIPVGGAVFIFNDGTMTSVTLTAS